MVLPEAVLDATSLSRDMNAIFSDDARAAEMAGAALSLGRPDAARRLLALVTDIAA